MLMFLPPPTSSSSWSRRSVGAACRIGGGPSDVISVAVVGDTWAQLPGATLSQTGEAAVVGAVKERGSSGGTCCSSAPPLLPSPTTPVVVVIITVVVGMTVTVTCGGGMQRGKCCRKYRLRWKPSPQLWQTYGHGGGWIPKPSAESTAATSSPSPPADR